MVVEVLEHHSRLTLQIAQHCLIISLVVFVSTTRTAGAQPLLTETRQRKNPSAVVSAVPLVEGVHNASWFTDNHRRHEVSTNYCCSTFTLPKKNAKRMLPNLAKPSCHVKSSHNG
jgi:hypothetical protein